MDSIDPMEFKTSFAVTSPTFGMPGILSEESPFRAKKSTISSGGTPNFSMPDCLS